MSEAASEPASVSSCRTITRKSKKFLRPEKHYKINKHFVMFQSPFPERNLPSGMSSYSGIKFSYKLKILKSSEEVEDVEEIVYDPHGNVNDKQSSGKTSGKASTWKAIANMTSFIQGAGAMALPYGVLKGGIATLIAFPIFALIHWYTGSVMINCIYGDEQEEQLSEYSTHQPGKRKRAMGRRILRVRSSFSDFGEVLWPSHGRALIELLQAVDLMILAVGYLIGSGSLMTHAFPTLGLSETWWTFIIAVLVLPSTFVKDISCVAWQSLLGVASLAFMAGALAWFTVTNSSWLNFKHVLFWDTEGFLVALGIVLSSYCVYSIVIPVEETMSDRSKFSSSLGISLFSCTIFKVLFALFGFLSFLHKTDEVIGNNFPIGLLRELISVVYLMYVVFSYILIIYPVLQFLDGCQLNSEEVSFIPSFMWIPTTRFFVVLTTFVIAVTIPHFALLTAFIGSLLLPSLEYVMPCLVHLKLKWVKLTRLEIFADISVIVLGILWTVLCGYSSGKALVIAMVKQ